ncbi:hypothetical protein ANANG_G00154960 [Anguilla anguilla]|uniref:Uncharacterized protein n=1 Tax=Anguilla anguilla TaxID=7936 RepID=A0A9D3RW51_ANGAN|nr:hypothetical protein ANANG_G00154960 [Anguilla anguilla]
MLALALAESAQQAAILSQRRPSAPPTPVSPSGPRARWTSWTPSLRVPQRSPERPQPAAGQVPSSGPPAATCKEAGPALQRGTEIQESGTVLLPTLQKPIPEQPITAAQPEPVSWGTPVTPAPSDPAEKPWEAIQPDHRQAEPVLLYHTHGTTPPAPPVRSIESKLATAALSRAEAANASNFHAILAEASMPASVEEALPHPPPPPRKSSTHQPAYLYHPEPMMEAAGEPYYHQRAVPAGQGTLGYHHYRPDSVPPHASYVSKSEPQIPYSARGYGPMDGATVYPTIRRVHSLHVPPSAAIRSVPISRTEVPPDDELFYYQRPAHQCKPYAPAPQADYHVTQLQPYFENGRVQYRYSPYSGAGPLDAPYYDVDPYGTIRLRHFHSFSARDLAPHLGRAGGKTGGYHYLSRHVLPAGKEHSFVSRDMPPSHGGTKGAAFYLAWDPEEADRLRVHSIRRESRARQKAKGPVMSQYDNVGPFPGPAELGSLEVLHLRSKSDPGKVVLMAPGAEGKEGRYAPRHMHSDPEALVYMETEKHCQGNGTGDRSALPSKERSSRMGGRDHPAQPSAQAAPPPPPRHLPQQPEPLRPNPRATPPTAGTGQSGTPAGPNPRAATPTKSRHRPCRPPSRPLPPNLSARTPPESDRSTTRPTPSPTRTCRTTQSGRARRGLPVPRPQPETQHHDRDVPLRQPGRLPTHTSAPANSDADSRARPRGCQHVPRAPQQQQSVLHRAGAGGFCCSRAVHAEA